MLEAGTAAAREAGLRAQRTFLPLHALPPEYSEDSAPYVASCGRRHARHGPRRGLIDAVDAFCEGIGFTLDETREMFEAARAKSACR